MSITVRVVGSTVLSNPVQYWYRSPVVSTVAPLTGPTSGGTAITISGSDLGVPMTASTLLGCRAVNRVLIGGRTCDVTQVRAATVPVSVMRSGWVVGWRGGMIVEAQVVLVTLSVCDWHTRTGFRSQVGGWVFLARECMSDTDEAYCMLGLC